MKTIALITDSTCDLPDAYLTQYKIKVLPHTIIWGMDTYKDRVEITPEQFYMRLRTDPAIPTTAHVSTYDYQQAFREAAKAGYQQALVYTISSAMSGAYHSACEAAQQADIPVEVVDGKGPTMSLGWQVLAAARLIKNGASLQMILEKTQQIRESLVQLVMLNHLDFLHRGGRIGNAKKLIGSLLDIRPIVRINHQTGMVESDSQARTYRKAVRLLYERFIGQVEVHKKLHIAVLHGNALESAQQLITWIEQELDPVELIVNITGPVLGVNTGPDALALCGYAE